ncbi:hypothetical protein DXG01_007135 [Tephrocybe rancida]|nr:hypothetical protein DXG01_007135 [Tephrocybe rancida]
MSKSSRPRRSSPSSAAASTLILVDILRQPAVLACLVNYIDWSALHTLLDTSRGSRSIFSDPAFRNLILARFVPGFEACRDSSTASQASLLPIDLHHLHLFNHVDELESLAAFTQAHSRFVLLLQSVVHSSHNLIIPPEPTHASLFEKLSSSIPELTSPAPLFYEARPLSPPHLSRSPPSKSKLGTVSGSTTRRLSKNIFKRPPVTPMPAPVAEPLALKTYCSTWRRSTPYRYPSEGVYSQSDSEYDLVPPRRTYVASGSTSINSSSRSSTPTPPTSNASPSPSPSHSRFPVSPLAAPTPHDLIHALSPTRAPVLRTYVPCSAPFSLPQTIIRCEEQIIDAELWSHLSVGDIIANLGHVPLSDEPPKPVSKVSDTKSRRTSTPRPPPAPPPAGNWLIFNGTFLVPFTSAPGAPVPIPDALTLPSPFYFTHILPRLANPIFALRRMPRFYTIPFTAAHDGPLSLAKEDVQMRLVHLPARVSTAHGGGVAVVRRYKWLARVFVNAPKDDADEPELGLGWQGEWILEGDGTKEGRAALMDYLVGRGRTQGRVDSKGKKGKKREQDHNEVEWEWELVRERCRKGRMWFKLLDVRMVGEDGLETPRADDLVGL